VTSSGDLVVGCVDESATGLSLSLHREHETGCRQNWSCCSRPLLFVANWKHICSSLPMDTGKQTGDCYMMRPRSPSRRRNGRRRNTNASSLLQLHLQQCCWLCHCLGIITLLYTGQEALCFRVVRLCVRACVSSRVLSLGGGILQSACCRLLVFWFFISIASPKVVQYVNHVIAMWSAKAELHHTRAQCWSQCYSS